MRVRNGWLRYNQQRQQRQQEMKADLVDMYEMKRQRDVKKEKFEGGDNFTYILATNELISLRRGEDGFRSEERVLVVELYGKREYQKYQLTFCDPSIHSLRLCSNGVNIASSLPDID